MMCQARAHYILNMIQAPLRKLKQKNREQNVQRRQKFKLEKKKLNKKYERNNSRVKIYPTCFSYKLNNLLRKLRVTLLLTEVVPLKEAYTIVQGSRKYMKRRPFHVFVALAQHMCLTVCLHMYYFAYISSFQIQYFVHVLSISICFPVFSYIFGCPVRLLKGGGWDGMDDLTMGRSGKVLSSGSLPQSKRATWHPTAPSHRPFQEFLHVF